jgi:predicted secreted protein
VLPPSVLTHPADQSVMAGETATFFVRASPVTSFQWQVSSDGGGSWRDVDGATGARLTTGALALSDSGSKFRAVVTNASGGKTATATSNAANLTVRAQPSVDVPAPSILTHPADQSVMEGQTATFAVTASPATGYQWQVLASGGTAWSDVPGATAARYTTGALPRSATGNKYRAVVTNAAGGKSATATSNAANLTVLRANTQPNPDPDGPSPDPDPDEPSPNPDPGQPTPGPQTPKPVIVPQAPGVISVVLQPATALAPRSDRTFRTYGDPVVRFGSGFEFSCNSEGRYHFLKTQPGLNWGDATPRALSFVSEVVAHVDPAGKKHHANSRFELDWSHGAASGRIVLDTGRGTLATPSFNVNGQARAWPLPASIAGVSFACAGSSVTITLPGGDKFKLDWTAQDWGGLKYYLNATVSVNAWPAGALYGVLGSVQAFTSPEAYKEARDGAGAMFTYGGKDGTEGIVEDVKRAYGFSSRPSPEHVKWRTPPNFIKNFRKT